MARRRASFAMLALMVGRSMSSGSKIRPPFDQALALWMSGLCHGLDELLEARDSADVFRRSAAGPVDKARVVEAGSGRRQPRARPIGPDHREVDDHWSRQSHKG